MNITASRMLIPVVLLASSLPVGAQQFSLDFDSGVDGWRTVVDGVMGGRSSGRVTQESPGVLQFSGVLSLENNGGFSQIRTSVTGDRFEGAEGIALRFRGDGRTYTFDVRCSNVRLMAGSFQDRFETTPGEWKTVRLPFDGFRLYNFGEPVRSAPRLDPGLIESIGVTLADKQAGPFRLEIDSIRAFGLESVDPVESAGDLASVASAAGLGTVMQLIEVAGLELPDEPVTIFAPTDAAFAALPEETVRGLTAPEGLDALRSILTYHVSPGRATSSDLLSRRTVPTLNGQRLSIEANGVISVSGADLVAVDVPFDGGIVHVIDAVMMPELRSIVELASSAPELSTLAGALELSGVTEQLDADNGPWTVFAPVDSAFAGLPEGTLDALLKPENRADLVSVLGLHVVPGRIYAGDLLANRSARSLLGESISFGIGDGRLRVGGAVIVTPDISACNGVIHLIDAVLLPDAPGTVSPESSREAAHLCELAISRGVPLFNGGHAAACASIYEIAIESMIGLGGEDLGRDVVQRLEQSLAAARAQSNWTDRAWTYRRALDAVHGRLTAQAGQANTTASRR